MTTDRDHDDAIATLLAERLEHRAAGVAVRSDIDDVFARAKSGTVDRNVERMAKHGVLAGGTTRTVLAAAAVIIVGLIGVLAVSGLPGNDREFAIQQAVSEALISDPGAAGESAGGEEVIIWLNPGVSDANVAAIRSWLDQERSIAGYRYIDRAETYTEFRAHFVDEPEILDLVTPEQLPTSFVATTTDRAALDGAVQVFAAIELVQSAAEAQSNSDE